MNLKELELLKEPKFHKFVEENKNILPSEVALKLSKNKMLPARAISEQVECYQKGKKKLPNLREKKLLFDKVALEQSSGEAAAKYKASLISGDSIIDLTGGLGIDEVFLATSFNKIVYCEINKVIYEIFKYNISKLNIKNIEVNNIDSIKYLSVQKDNSFNWIYIDPSRRDNIRRSVDLEYCAPNVYDNMELFFSKSKNIMVKVAPAFDLTEAVRRFPNLTAIHVVSVDGECKEVLLLLNRDIKNIIPKLFAVSINTQNNKNVILEDKFGKDDNRKITSLQKYFYEPDCSFIKSNTTPLLASEYEFTFINKATPYLTSNNLKKNFPGRSFSIISSMFFKEKEIKKYFRENEIKKANIAKRDFNLNVSELRKKFNLKDGGELYFFFTKDFNDKKIMIICKKT